MICSSCGSIIPDKVASCAYCNAVQPKKTHTCQRCETVLIGDKPYCTACGQRQYGSDNVASQQQAPTPPSYGTYNPYYNTVQAPPNRNYNYNYNYNYQPSHNPYAYGIPPQYIGVPRKSRLTAGFLGLFLGCFGVHNFYLGYNGRATAQLLITVLSFGLLMPISALWGLIEGIIILSDRGYREANGTQLLD